MRGLSTKKSSQARIKSGVKGRRVGGKERKARMSFRGGRRKKEQPIVRAGPKKTCGGMEENLWKAQILFRGEAEEKARGSVESGSSVEAMMAEKRKRGPGENLRKGRRIF